MASMINCVAFDIGEKRRVKDPKKGMGAPQRLLATLLAVTTTACLPSTCFAQADSGSPASQPQTEAPFAGKIGLTPESSVPDWPMRTKAPARAPNILLILTDDMGFGTGSTFGGPVPTPNLDRLAAEGARYSNFHTTAMCSPTRAALLTGRNSHAVGSGAITDAASGYPGYNSVIPRSAATVARILRDGGYSTAMFGKHHNIPRWEASLAGPFTHWPTGLGFEYFFGFIIGDTNQWHPRLYRNTVSVDAPGNESTLDALLADDAIHWIHQQKAIAPDKPFFVYVAPGTSHGPHQAPPEWIARFRGQFDKGWDAVRADTFARQKRLGIIPVSARLTPRPAELPAWTSLSRAEQRVSARHMEVYAASVAHLDAQIGRVLDELARMGQLDNTLVFFIQGDNGASGEGGLRGTFNEIGHHRNGLAERTAERDLPHLDDLGGPRSYPLYPAPWGWAMDTPFQWMKQVASHLGGIRNGMVVRWPHVIAGGSTPRGQFVHVSDIMPTILEATGLPLPGSVDGVPQQPLTGKSLAYTFKDPAAIEPQRTQYFEMLGNRAIYSNGWFANTVPRRAPWTLSPPAGDAFSSYRWQLYDLRKDFSQSRDLAAVFPEKLEEMRSLFLEEARKYNVLPIDDRINADRQNAARRHYGSPRSRYEYWGKAISVAEDESPEFAGHSFHIRAEVAPAAPDVTGVILARGSWFGGWSLFLAHGVPTVVVARSERPEDQTRIAALAALPAGFSVIDLEFTADSKKRDSGGRLCLSANRQPATCRRVERAPASDAGQGETFDIGFDTGAPVASDYPIGSPFPGVLNKVTFEYMVSSEATTPSP